MEVQRAGINYEGSWGVFMHLSIHVPANEVMLSGVDFPQSDSALTGNKDQREALCHNFL